MLSNLLYYAMVSEFDSNLTVSIEWFYAPRLKLFQQCDSLLHSELIQLLILNLLCETFRDLNTCHKYNAALCRSCVTPRSLFVMEPQGRTFAKELLVSERKEDG